MQNTPYVIAFDADDTLWDHESYFIETREILGQKLNRYISPEALDVALYEVEKKNIPFFGYGVKGFIISVIETAAEVSQNRITAAEISEIIELGKQLMAHPIQLRPHVESTLQELTQRHPLTLITKGDLTHQETKIAASGIGHYFTKIEIVSEKCPATYLRFLQKEQVEPENFLMIGNSLRSDVLPAVEIGGSGIYVPSGYIWVHDEAPEEAQAGKTFIELDSMEHCVAHVNAWIAERSG